MFLKIILGIEILTAIFATYYFYKFKNTPLKLWILLLFLAPLTKIIVAWNATNGTLNNQIILNIHDLIHHLILFKLIYDLISQAWRKKVMLWIIGFTVLLFAVNGMYESDFSEHLILYKSALTALVIFSTALYLGYTLKRVELLRFKENLAFIVFSGYMIYNIVYLPIYLTNQYLVHMETGDETILPVLSTLRGATLLMMNLFFIFGLIWTHPHLNKNKQG
tara:strand:+ start:60054 stop:60716 length:663 start_codon:yes stop_codon:yes gene_type:complete